jgi:hypothetical protein
MTFLAARAKGLVLALEILQAVQTGLLAEGWCDFVDFEDGARHCCSTMFDGSAHSACSCGKPDREWLHKSFIREKMPQLRIRAIPTPARSQENPFV